MLFVCGLQNIVLICVPFIQSDSLPFFCSLSIVGRQMGASVTRRGVFDHSEAWVHYEGYE